MICASRPLERGDVVRVRNERWRVVQVALYEGCAIVEAAGGEPSNAGRTGRFILPFESVERVSGAADEPRVVSPAAWRSTARASLADAVPDWHALRAAAGADITLWPFQLEPALAMTRGLASRVLLADEVGLGKTIQAGLLIAELLAREREGRVLIVTPASLREQWRDELRDRFAVDADVIDAAALARAAAHLPEGVNPWALPRVAITSIDFLKRADVIRSLEPLVWDLVAFDEAHALCGRSDRALAADLVAARSRRVVIITATPHSGDEAAFGRLRALGRIGCDDALLTFRRSRAEVGVPGARAMRRLYVAPAPGEARMHRTLGAYAARVSRDAPVETAAAARLAMLVLARRATSSAASLARSVERRLALIGSAGGAAGDGPSQLRLPLDEGHIPEDDEPIQELAAPGLAESAIEERLLGEILGLARGVGFESKIASLQRLLARTREPALVFTEYRDTLRHVASAIGGDPAVLHGGLTTGERAHEARRFTHGAAQVLLATDAASEGLNLHRRCRLVINLDVPWTPLRLEQRVGRVDRLGQTRRVHAVTFVARGTCEAVVAAALSSRSFRAERGAPFGRVGDEAMRLQMDAEAEAKRLAIVRQLTNAAPALCPLSSRSALTVLSATGRSRRAASHREELVLAIRFLFVGPTGVILGDTIKGFALGHPGPPDRRATTVRTWFRDAVAAHALVFSRTSAFVHEAALNAFSRQMRAATARLLAREHAMLERVTGTQGRLAAPLMQPGLFDRRAVHDAEAQRRVAAEAAARATERIRALERITHLHQGERRLVFALAWSR